jgi:hypothetical protein
MIKEERAADSCRQSIVCNKVGQLKQDSNIPPTLLKHLNLPV